MQLIIRSTSIEKNNATHERICTILFLPAKKIDQSALYVGLYDFINKLIDCEGVSSEGTQQDVEKDSTT